MGGSKGGMDGWVGGWVDGWTDGWVDGWMGRGMDGWMEGRHGWMDGWVGGGMDGWMDGWMDGGWVKVCTREASERKTNRTQKKKETMITITDHKKGKTIENAAETHNMSGRGNDMEEEGRTRERERTNK